jgi:acetyl-CoA C-acetyltransferase
MAPRARVVATAVTGSDPTIMLALAGLSIDDIDLIELNEAFASVVLKFQRDMKIRTEKVNVNGGAIAMGHPLGTTGAMLVDELERRGQKRAVITLCVGGGMGIATIIERV